MTELIICGQAPSRIGDGRAFSGPSGRRLAKLFGLEDYEALAAQFTLTNIFDVPAKAKSLPARRRTHNAPGDEFDRYEAHGNAQWMLYHWTREKDKERVVLACGHKVYNAFMRNIPRQSTPYYKGSTRVGIDVWCFPHPSGASQYWNNPEHVAIATNFLKRLLDRYGITIE